MRLVGVKAVRGPAARGATVVEFAVSASVTLILIFGLIIGGLGVFRYQEVAHLAREGSRFAATHGGKYAAAGLPGSTGVPAIASSSDMRNYLLPKCVILDPDRLTVTASWTASGTYTPANLPSYVDTDPTLVPPAQRTIQNYVTVTVSYQWLPELIFVGPITLTSTSTMQMSY